MEGSNDRTALLAEGAMRLGKSYIIEEFAKNEYKTHLIIDFNIASQQVKDIFLEDLSDLKTLFLKLSTFYQICSLREILL